MIVALLFASATFAQTTIWSENFNTAADQGVGATGPSGPPSSPTSGKWSVTANYTGLTATDDWFRVQSNVFEARDVDEEQAWTSEVISITGYTNVSFSMDVVETGDHESTDYVNVYYKIDGGAQQLALSVNDDFNSAVASASGLSGSTLQLIAYMKNNAAAEYLTLDNIIVQGTAAGPCNEPTTAASNITFTNVSHDNLDVNWNTGNGSQRMVIMKAGPITPGDLPVDGTSYTASNTFGSGSQIGSAYVVFKGFGTSVTVSGLSATTTYYAAVIEFDCSPEDYKTDTYPSGSQTTTACQEPTTAASVITFTNVGTNDFDISWTNGNGNFRIVVLSESAITAAEVPTDGVAYTPNATFGVGDAIGSGYVVYDGASNTVSVAGLNSGTTYYAAVFEYQCASKNYNTTGYPTNNQTTNTVTPTQLIFSSYPSSGCMEANDYFDVTVCAADASEVVDNTYTGTITLSKNSGPGNLGGTLTAPATNGCATFSNLTLSAVGSYLLDATDGSLNGTTVNPVQIYNSCTATSSWQGLIVNEFSNGYSGSKEYMEFVVLGECGQTVDITGWIFDDQNGSFADDPAVSAGIAQGHFRFGNNGTWTSVPVGSIILVYNDAEPNGSISMPDDPTDGNLDSVYILPHTSTLLETTTTAYGKSHKPSASPLDTSYTPVDYESPPTTWTTIGMANTGDLTQVRAPDGSYYHGASYGSNTNVNGGPDSNKITNTSGYRTVFSFTTGDYRDAANWTALPIAGEPDANETPGSANNAANAQWIKDIRDAAANPCILPVELVTFEALPINNQVLLRWVTATEVNSDHFEIQRSADGSYFETIGTVAAHGHSVSALNYDFTDGYPLAGVSYYRLLTFDKEGFSDFSEVVKVALFNTLQFDIEQVYPVPTKEILFLDIASPTQSQIEAEVVNLLGQRVKQIPNLLINKGSNHIALDVHELSKGTYFLKVTDGFSHAVEKFIIK